MCIPPDKKKGVNFTLQVQSPHPTKVIKVKITYPLEGLSRQMPYSPGTENAQMPGCTGEKGEVGGGGEGWVEEGKVPVDRRNYFQVKLN